MKTRWGLAAAILALTVATVFVPWRATPSAAQMGPGMGPPLDELSGEQFDRAFLMQMSMHHAMAITMARPVAANASHQELKDLGSQIIADQTRELEQMRAWARDWYGLEVPDMVAMMDPAHGGQMSPGGMPMGPGGMPGGPMGNMPMGQMDMSMMADLWELPPNRLEAVFMSLMIPHHQGAVGMANLALDRAARPELKELAGQVIASQSAEIEQMNTWLAAWYGL
jgi:uncharacterized protein (DUF305 family)